MSQSVIQVKELSKKYRIGKASKRSDTIFGELINGLRQPLQNLKQIRSLSKLTEDEDSIFWALKDISFEVKEGEVLGIIGHNGAGKSTLLKILSRITEPSGGEAHIKGRVAALLEVGTGFHQELTGRENIYMNGTILGMRKKEIDARLDEIINFSGVEKYLDTPVKFYSSGMRVRLGFSVAAHLEPEILIIDEVLAVGDAEFQNKCIGKISRIAGEGRTVLFVSHDVGAIQRLCTRALLLQNGTTRLEGLPSDVLREYLKKADGLHRKTKTSQLKKDTSVYLNDMRILHGSDAEGNVLITGDSVTFEIEYGSIYTSWLPVGIYFHLFFKSEMSANLFVLSTRYSILKSNRLPAQGKMICKINNLPLLSGGYYIDACVKSEDETLLYIEKIKTFSVENGNMKGYRRMPSNSAGPFTVEHEWI